MKGLVHLALLSLLVGCGAELDAGSDRLRGTLPVDARSPIVVLNDGPNDNWHAEYAVTLAGAGRIKLAGIVVNTVPGYPSLTDNVRGFRDLVAAARESGMSGLPEPTASVAPPLVRPDNADLERTVPNRSEGARFILDAAARLSTPVHPLVIATGGALTDIADAYLLDNSLPARVVVVASLGGPVDSVPSTGDPNGPNDPWAAVIVSARFRYVQVNGFYDQLQEIPEQRVPELPANSWGRWISAKRPKILDLFVACDQVSVMAVAFPGFALDVERMSSPVTPALGLPASFVPDPTGNVWHVPRSDAASASGLFWDALKDPRTYGK